MRNIVLITIDDLRFDHCRFMGYERDTTPTIDKMARKGTYFTNAYAPAHNTPSSMKAIFTGNYLTVDTGFGKIDIFREEIIKTFKREKTLAQVLRKWGYTTGAFTPSAYASSYFGFNKGFDYFRDYVFRDRNSILYKIYRQIFRSFTKGSTKAFIIRSFLDFIQGEGAFMHWEKYYDEIIGWVEKVKEPFFLWIFPLDTHRPYLAPRKFRKWSSAIDMYVYNFYYNYLISKHRGRLTFGEKERKRLINAYDDSIYYVDNMIKKLWNNLKDYDPIFIIHADHGEAFGEHGFYEHQPFLYEEVIHVPLVIFNADWKEKVTEPISLIGLAPTIFELLGINADFPSKSFMHNRDSIVISKTYEEGRKIAIRIQNWKYIEGQKPGGELYNLEEDPYEQVNLVKEEPRLSKELQKLARRILKQDLEKMKIRDVVSKMKL